MVRKFVSAKVENPNTVRIREILISEPDLKRALDLIVPLLAVFDPWRVEKYGKDVCSITELLYLQDCHERLRNVRRLRGVVR